MVLNAHISPEGMNNKPVCGRSSETYSHPIDMIINIISTLHRSLVMEVAD
jgi:hypothetical protein